MFFQNAAKCISNLPLRYMKAGNLQKDLLLDIPIWDGVYSVLSLGVDNGRRNPGSLAVDFLQKSLFKRKTISIHLLIKIYMYCWCLETEGD